MTAYPERPPVEPAILADLVVETQQSEPIYKRIADVGRYTLSKVVDFGRNEFSSTIAGVHLVVEAAIIAPAKPVCRAIARLYNAADDIEPKTMVGVAAKGFAMGVPNTLKEYGQTIAQTATDVRIINKLEANRQAEITASGIPETKLATFKRRMGKVAMAGWYATAVPAYQLFDDALTYPLFLGLQHQHGTPGAYGLAAVAGFGLAMGTAIIQRSVEKEKAKLIHAETTPDHSPWFKRVLDSSVNSSMWQVMLAANKPRDMGEPVPIVGLNRISQYAAAYALANTALYATADSLPVGEWTGFGLSLAFVWSAGNAVEEVKQRLHSNKKATV